MIITRKIKFTLLSDATTIAAMSRKLPPGKISGVIAGSRSARFKIPDPASCRLHGKNTKYHLLNYFHHHM